MRSLLFRSPCLAAAAVLATGTRAEGAESNA